MDRTGVERWRSLQTGSDEPRQEAAGALGNTPAIGWPTLRQAVIGQGPDGRP